MARRGSLAPASKFAVSAVMLIVLVACSTATNPAGALEPTSEGVGSPKPSRSSKPDPARTIAVPKSIDASGKTNVSSAMASFISDVPDGSTIVFPRDATYLLDGNGFVLVGRDDLVFDGRGTTLKFTGCGTNDSAFKLKDTHGITIRDFTLVGDNPGSYNVGCESSEGVAMYGATDITISRVDVHRPYGHCWYAEQYDRGNGSTSDWTDGVLIEDSSCVRAGVMGFAVVAGRNIVIERTTFKDIAITPFDIEPHDTDGGGEKITMRDNVIDGFGVSERYTPWLFAAAPSIGSYKDIRFERNHVIRGAHHGSTLAGLSMRVDGTGPKSNFIVRDNTSDVAGEGPVMRFRNVDGLTVTGNEQPLERGDLVSCSGCSNVVVQ